MPSGQAREMAPKCNRARSRQLPGIRGARTFEYFNPSLIFHKAGYKTRAWPRCRRSLPDFPRVLSRYVITGFKALALTSVYEHLVRRVQKVFDQCGVWRLQRGPWRAMYRVSWGCAGLRRCARNPGEPFPCRAAVVPEWAHRVGISGEQRRRLVHGACDRYTRSRAAMRGIDRSSGGV